MAPAEGSIQILVRGADRVAADLERMGVEAELRAYAITRTYTMLLQARVRARASGRPGPRTPTGDYRRSITGEVERRAGVTVGTVGTSRPQGRRLEFGYYDTDALGRTYRQPPYPHFRPAMGEVEEAYVTAMHGAVGP